MKWQLFFLTQSGTSDLSNPFQIFPPNHERVHYGFLAQKLKQTPNLRLNMCASTHKNVSLFVWAQSIARGPRCNGVEKCKNPWHTCLPCNSKAKHTNFQSLPLKIPKSMFFGRAELQKSQKKSCPNFCGGLHGWFS